MASAIAHATFATALGYSGSSSRIESDRASMSAPRAMRASEALFDRMGLDISPIILTLVRLSSVSQKESKNHIRAAAQMCDSAIQGYTRPVGSGCHRCQPGRFRAPVFASLAGTAEGRRSDEGSFSIADSFALGSRSRTSCSSWARRCSTGSSIGSSRKMAPRTGCPVSSHSQWTLNASAVFCTLATPGFLPRIGSLSQRCTSPRASLPPEFASQKPGPLPDSSTK